MFVNLYPSNIITAPDPRLYEHQCGILSQIPSPYEVWQYQTRVKYLRPLRRLLRRILRPEGEAERAKNPILRLLGMTWG